MVVVERPGRGSDQFMLRFPDGMRDKIKVAADTNNRSMNAEIISRLEESFDFERRLKFKELMAKANTQLIDNYAEMTQSMQVEMAEMRKDMRALMKQLKTRDGPNK